MTPSCIHSLHHITAAGQPAGSWRVETVRQGKHSRQRVVCAHCGKFYGYLGDRPEQERKEAVSREPERSR